MTSLSIQEAQARLPDLVHGLALGDKVVLVENDHRSLELFRRSSGRHGCRVVRAHCGAPCFTWPRTLTPRSKTSRSTWDRLLLDTGSRSVRTDADLECGFITRPAARKSSREPSHPFAVPRRFATGPIFTIDNII